ncbi:maleylpyruvate isomerase family mycothiol-dependent enzyme [Saccharothrix hoggarensis]|uniref:Maleylpyruvate isomerase family mycothiol-dependent enzyme n=1 Tax=Saccharothrix hoggarensis TaxID=913853 RepID=A0ABW3QEZ2_9PSEU
MGIDHTGVVEEYSRSFTEAVEGNLGAPVPTCPGWTVADLVAHLAEVQSWWTLVVLAKGALPDDEAARRAADTGPDLVEGWREISARYVAVQREYPSDGPAWAWWNDASRDTAAGVAWRQAHEAVVHCWDAWRAAGAVRAIPADLAADGVDEFLTRFLHGEEWAGGRATVDLTATDTGATWRVGAGGAAKPARLAVSDVPADGVVTGTAEQLYLLLWRRIGVEEVVVTGDATKVDAVLQWPNLT